MWLSLARESADPDRETWIIERHDTAFSTASASDRTAALALIERQQGPARALRSAERFLLFSTSIASGRLRLRNGSVNRSFLPCASPPPSAPPCSSFRRAGRGQTSYENWPVLTDPFPSTGGGGTS